MCMYNSILVGGGGGWGFTKKEERSLHQNYESKTAGGGGGDHRSSLRDSIQETKIHKDPIASHHPIQADYNFK